MAQAAAHRRSTNILGRLGLGKFVATAGLFLLGYGTRAQDTSAVVAHNDTIPTATHNIMSAVDSSFWNEGGQNGIFAAEENPNPGLAADSLDVDSAAVKEMEEPAPQQAKKKQNKKEAHTDKKPRAPISIASYIDIMANEPAVQRIAEDRGLSALALCNGFANMLRIESPHGENQLDMAAKAGDSSAEGIYQFTRDTRNGLLAKASPAVQLAAAAAKTPEERMHVDNKLFIDFIEYNLSVADEFVSYLQKGHGMPGGGGVEELWLYNEFGKECRVNVNDPRLPMAVAFYLHFGEGHFGNNVNNGVLGDIHGKRALRMSTTIVGDQDAMRHFCAAGIEPLVDGHSPAYLAQAARAREELKGFLTDKNAVDKVESLNDEFSMAVLAHLKYENKKHPDGITIFSGYRSFDNQAGLFADAVEKYGSEEAADDHVAPPGHSNHEFGLALDLRYKTVAARKSAHRSAAKFGLNFPMSWENWHIEPKSEALLAHIRGKSHHEFEQDVDRMMAANGRAADALAKEKAVAKSDTLVLSADSVAAALAANKAAADARAAAALERAAGQEENGWSSTLLSLMGWKEKDRKQGRDPDHEDPVIAQILRSGRTAVKEVIHMPERGAGSSPPQQGPVVLARADDGVDIPTQIRGQDAPEPFGPVVLRLNDKPAFTAGDVVDLGDVTIPQNINVEANEIVTPVVAPDAPEQVVAKEFKQNKNEICSDTFREKYFGKTITIEGVGTREINEAFLLQAQEIYGGKAANAVIARAYNRFDQRTIDEMLSKPDASALSATSKLARGLSAPAPVQA